MSTFNWADCVDDDDFNVPQTSSSQQTQTTQADPGTPSTITPSRPSKPPSTSGWTTLTLESLADVQSTPQTPATTTTSTPSSRWSAISPAPSKPPFSGTPSRALGRSTHHPSRPSYMTPHKRHMVKPLAAPTPISLIAIPDSEEAPPVAAPSQPSSSSTSPVMAPTPEPAPAKPRAWAPIPEPKVKAPLLATEPSPPPTPTPHAGGHSMHPPSNGAFGSRSYASARDGPRYERDGSYQPPSKWHHGSTHSHERERWPEREEDHYAHAHAHAPTERSWRKAEPTASVAAPAAPQQSLSEALGSYLPVALSAAPRYEELLVSPYYSSGYCTSFCYAGDAPQTAAVAAGASNTPSCPARGWFGEVALAELNVGRGYGFLPSAAHSDAQALVQSLTVADLDPEGSALAAAIRGLAVPLPPAPSDTVKVANVLPVFPHLTGAAPHLRDAYTDTQQPLVPLTPVQAVLCALPAPEDRTGALPATLPALPAQTQPHQIVAAARQALAVPELLLSRLPHAADLPLGSAPLLPAEIEPLPVRCRLALHARTQQLYVVDVQFLPPHAQHCARADEEGDEAARAAGKVLTALLARLSAQRTLTALPPPALLVPLEALLAGPSLAMVAREMRDVPLQGRGNIHHGGTTATEHISYAADPRQHTHAPHAHVAATASAVSEGHGGAVCTVYGVWRQHQYVDLWSLAHRVLAAAARALTSGADPATTVRKFLPAQGARTLGHVDVEAGERWAAACAADAHPPRLDAHAAYTHCCALLGALAQCYLADVPAADVNTNAEVHRALVAAQHANAAAAAKGSALPFLSLAYPCEYTRDPALLLFTERDVLGAVYLPQQPDIVACATYADVVAARVGATHLHFCVAPFAPLHWAQQVRAQGERAASWASKVSGPEAVEPVATRVVLSLSAFSSAPWAVDEDAATGKDKDVKAAEPHPSSTPASVSPASALLARPITVTAAHPPLPAALASAHCHWVGPFALPRRLRMLAVVTSVSPVASASADLFLPASVCRHLNSTLGTNLPLCACSAPRDKNHKGKGDKGKDKPSTRACECLVPLGSTHVTAYSLLDATVPASAAFNGYTAPVLAAAPAAAPAYPLLPQMLAPPFAMDPYRTLTRGAVLSVELVASTKHAPTDLTNLPAHAAPSWSTLTAPHGRAALPTIPGIDARVRPLARRVQVLPPWLCARVLPAAFARTVAAFAQADRKHAEPKPVPMAAVPAAAPAPVATPAVAAHVAAPAPAPAAAPKVKDAVVIPAPASVPAPVVSAPVAAPSATTATITAAVVPAPTPTPTRATMPAPVPAPVPAPAPAVVADKAAAPRTQPALIRATPVPPSPQPLATVWVLAELAPAPADRAHAQPPTALVRAFIGPDGAPHTPTADPRLALALDQPPPSTVPVPCPFPIAPGSTAAALWHALARVHDPATAPPAHAQPRATPLTVRLAAPQTTPAPVLSALLSSMLASGAHTPTPVLAHTLAHVPLPRLLPALARALASPLPDPQFVSRLLRAATARPLCPGDRLLVAVSGTSAAPASLDYLLWAPVHTFAATSMLAAFSSLTAPAPHPPLPSRREWLSLLAAPATLAALPSALLPCRLQLSRVSRRKEHAGVTLDMAAFALEDDGQYVPADGRYIDHAQEKPDRHAPRRGRHARAPAPLVEAPVKGVWTMAAFAIASRAGPFAARALPPRTPVFLSADDVDVLAETTMELPASPATLAQLFAGLAAVPLPELGAAGVAPEELEDGVLLALFCVPVGADRAASPRVCRATLTHSKTLYQCRGVHGYARVDKPEDRHWAPVWLDLAQGPRADMPAVTRVPVWTGMYKSEELTLPADVMLSTLPAPLYAAMQLQNDLPAREAGLLLCAPVTCTVHVNAMRGTTLCSDLQLLPSSHMHPVDAAHTQAQTPMQAQAQAPRVPRDRGGRGRGRHANKEEVVPAVPVAATSKHGDKHVGGRHSGEKHAATTIAAPKPTDAQAHVQKHADKHKPAEAHADKRDVPAHAAREHAGKPADRPKLTRKQAEEERRARRERERESQAQTPASASASTSTSATLVEPPAKQDRVRGEKGEKPGKQHKEKAKAAKDAPPAPAEAVPSTREAREAPRKQGKGANTTGTASDKPAQDKAVGDKEKASGGRGERAQKHNEKKDRKHADESAPRDKKQGKEARPVVAPVAVPARAEETKDAEEKEEARRDAREEARGGRKQRNRGVPATAESSGTLGSATDNKQHVRATTTAGAPVTVTKADKPENAGKSDKADKPEGSQKPRREHAPRQWRSKREETAT